MSAPESITCPRCGRTSSHPNDVRERYCGVCHQWHEHMPEALALALEQLGEHVGFELAPWQRWWLEHLPADLREWHTLYVTTPPRRSTFPEALRERLRSMERHGFVHTKWSRDLCVIDEVFVWRDREWWRGRQGRGIDELGLAVVERDPEPCGWHQRGGYRLPGAAVDVEPLPRGWPLW